MARRAARPLVLSVEEAGRLVLPGVTRSAWYQAAAEGRLPVRRIGRRLVVPVPALASLLGVRPEDIWSALEAGDNQQK